MEKKISNIRIEKVKGAVLLKVQFELAETPLKRYWLKSLTEVWPFIPPQWASNNKNLEIY